LVFEIDSFVVQFKLPSGARQKNPSQREGFMGIVVLVNHLENESTG
jgi:hypothetical protein